MKKNKKILLALGTVASIAAPIATVVSCGSSSVAAVSDGAVTVKTSNFINGSTVTGFVPTDQSKWYAPIVSDRVLDESGNGVTPFGLFDGVNQKAYAFGTMENSIAYNLGYLQAGKLLMISYYKAHPVTDTNDIRSSLTQLGDVLNDSFTSYFTNHEDEFDADTASIKDTAVKADLVKVKAALKDYKVEDVIQSSAKNISNLDYRGLHGLAEVFNQTKYDNAAEGSDEETLNHEVMKYVGGVFNQFAWDLHVHVTGQTVAENEKLFYAYDEVMGYSWDAYTGVLGDRKNPSIGLQKTWVKTPLPIDHYENIGNYEVEDGHRDLKYLEPVTNSIGTYSGQLFRFAGTDHTPDESLYSEVQNETLGLGIIPVDEGFPVYDNNGNLEAGSEASKRVYKFGLFDSITITSKGDTPTTTVFNKDTSDDDPASINSKTFKDAIETGASKIVVHVKTGTTYTKGGTLADSTNKVTAGDFWTGIQMDAYASNYERNDKGTWGGTDLPADDGDQPRNSIAKKFEDAISKSTTNKTESWASPSKTEVAGKPAAWDNFGTRFGIEPFEDTPKRRAEVVDDAANTLTIDFKDNADASGTTLLWNDLFANPGVSNLHAEPTEFVKSQSIAFAKKVGFTDDELSILETKPGIKYGVYYAYAANSLSDFEFAGRYIPTKAESGQISWGQNAKYAGTWANKAKAPLSYTVEYIDQSSAYLDIYKQQYEQDRIWKAPIADKKLKGWHDAILQESEADQKTLGVKYTKAQTSKGDVGTRFQTLGLPFGTKNPTDAKYYFGDNFAKVMYGGTIKEIWEAPTLEGLAETLWHGTGLEFRSSLQTAINPYALVSNFQPGAMGAMSTYGPEAVIPGTGAAETVYDSEIFNRAAFGKNFVEVSDTEYRAEDAASEGSAGFHVSGELLTKLKANIADALEKAGVTGNIVSELPIDYLSGLNSVNVATALQNYLKTLNSFNEHIHFAANTNPAKVLEGEEAK